MFAFIFNDVGAGEWLVLLAVILIVVGPKRLPEVARKFGQYYARFRRAAENFKRQLLEMDTEFTRSVQEAQRAAEGAIKEAEDAFKVDGNEATATPGTARSASDVPPMKEPTAETVSPAPTYIPTDVPSEITDLEKEARAQEATQTAAEQVTTSTPKTAAEGTAANCAADSIQGESTASTPA